MRLNDKSFKASLSMKTNIQSIENLAKTFNKQDIESKTNKNNQFVIFIFNISAFF